MVNDTTDSSRHHLRCLHSQENKPSDLLISVSHVCVEAGIKDPFIPLHNSIQILSKTREKKAFAHVAAVD